MKKTNKIILLCSAIALLGVSILTTFSSDLKANNKVNNNQKRSGFAEFFLENGEDLTPEQIEILENMPALEEKYLEYGLNAPVDPNFKKID